MARLNKVVQQFTNNQNHHYHLCPVILVTLQEQISEVNRNLAQLNENLEKTHEISTEYMRLQEETRPGDIK